jgi:protein-S-isoprenylcysteine O-methyltransferase
LVLWRFFSRRISGEEELLVAFFGDDYVRYRKRTSVGIPFIP